MGFHLIDGEQETIEACGACEAFGRGSKEYRPRGGVGLCQRHFNIAIEKVLDASEYPG
jgi:hypothetical protein